MTLRRVAVLIAVLLLAVQVVRNAAVAAYAPLQPAAAAKLWASHPDVERSLALTDIAAAARDGRPVPQTTFAMLDRVAVEAPLAPDPYLVRGVQWRLDGRDRLALQAFRAAEMRDSRSLPARYFLADLYLRSGDLRHGLEQFGALARLAPNATGAVAPFVANFAADRRNWPQLRQLFRSDPKLEGAALVALAQDPDNADLIMALASPDQRTASSSWAGPLLNGLVQRGQYAEARRIWARLAGVNLTPNLLLNNPEFRSTGSQSPFDWQLTSSGLGLAEAQPGGRLHLLYYGQDNGVLARQLVVLQPGRYRLSNQMLGGGSHPEALSWVVQCTTASAPLGSMRVAETARHGFVFEVPSGCPAAWLQLTGNAADLPQQTDVTMSALRLTRDPPSE